MIMKPYTGVNLESDLPINLYIYIKILILFRRKTIYSIILEK